MDRSKTNLPRLLMKACSRCKGDVVREYDDILMIWELKCIQCGREHNPPSTLPLVTRERAESMAHY